VDDDEVVQVGEVCNSRVWRNIEAGAEEAQCPLLTTLANRQMVYILYYSIDLSKTSTALSL
jgi:hypothetical protein